MNETIRAYPLQWPDGWPRAQARTPGLFNKKEARRPDGVTTTVGKVQRDLTIADGCERVLGVLRQMDIPDDDIVVSSNVKPRLDGMPSGRGASRGDIDPGVAVYWKRKGKRQCIAIDRYSRVADNLAAIAATLDAMRAIDRHGGAQILDRAFTGFVALPAPEQWFTILGVSAHATRGEIETAHSRLAMKHHPDRGGTDYDMSRINTARDEGLKQ